MSGSIESLSGSLESLLLKIRFYSILFKMHVCIRVCTSGLVPVVCMNLCGCRSQWRTSVSPWAILSTLFETASYFPRSPAFKWGWMVVSPCNPRPFLYSTGGTCVYQFRHMLYIMCISLIQGSCRVYCLWGGMEYCFREVLRQDPSWKERH